MSILKSNHLTTDAVNDRALLTHPGQAHFADPTLGETCGNCAFWGTLYKRKTCFKARGLGVHASASLPSHAIACKYFEKEHAPAGN